VYSEYVKGIMNEDLTAKSTVDERVEAVSELLSAATEVSLAPFQAGLQQRWEKKVTALADKDQQAATAKAEKAQEMEEKDRVRDADYKQATDTANELEHERGRCPCPLRAVARMCALAADFCMFCRTQPESSKAEGTR
jgi:hypothetical protein